MTSNTANKKVAPVTGASSGMGKAFAYAKPMLFIRKGFSDRVFDKMVLATAT